MSVINYLKAFVTCLASFVFSYFHPIMGIIYLFFAFFAIDFITGLLASFSKGHKFRSFKARESFFKFLIYIGAFSTLLAIGVELSKLGNVEDLDKVMTVLKLVICIAIWFEAKSNAENLKIIFPNNRFIAFMDYLLGVEFIKKIKWLDGFLDYEKRKTRNPKHVKHKKPE